jgi:hypothetical protein
MTLGFRASESSLGLALGALMALGPAPALLDDHTPSSEDVCQKAEIEMAESARSQVQSYCEAARRADKAAREQQIIAGIQATVMAVCTASCLGAFGVTSINDGWCSAASVGAAVYTFAKAKEITAKIMALSGPGLMLYSNDFELEKTFHFKARTGAEPARSAGDTASKGANSESKASKGACFAAALAGVGSLMSFSGAGNSKSSARANRKAANDLRGYTTMGIKTGGVAISAGGQITGGTGAIVNRAGDTRRAETNSPPPSLSDPCSQDSFEANTQCAVAVAGGTVPPFVSSPDFRDTLEKLSGVSADRLIGLRNPQSIMQAALGRVLTPEGQEKFGAIIKDASASSTNVLASTYIGGGGARPGPGSQDTPDLDSLIDKILPGDAQNQETLGAVGEIDFGPDREIVSRAGDEDDRRVSLFSRVSGRYRLGIDRVTSREIQMERTRMKDAKARSK